MVTPPKLMRCFSTSVGKNFGSAPKTNWPPYSSRNDTPMAVISDAILGAFRSGRYAIRSLRNPKSPHTTIDSAAYISRMRL